MSSTLPEKITTEPAENSERHEPAKASGKKKYEYARIPPPAESKPVRIYWEYLIPLVLVHVLALLAFIPSYFSVSALVVGIVAHCVFDGLGVSIGYHRLLTHRGFQCPKWLEHLFAIFGICTLQDSPARWVAVHRMHHQHSDHQPDPHSPLVTFFWGHVGWLLIKDRRHDSVYHFERYAKDLLRDRFYFQLEKNLLWFWVYVAHAVLFVLAGVAWGYAWTGTWAGAYASGMSWFVWAVLVRTVFTLNVTWAVNSVGHMWGYRNYETRDNSQNSWWVALCTFGEGWHNNHHADQRSARHGHQWWEIDMSWMVIQSLKKIGLASNVIGPRVSPNSASTESLTALQEQDTRESPS